MSFTWLGVTHWLVETPEGGILLDAYVSRAPFSELGPNEGGLVLWRRIVAASNPPPIRWIFVGHSHFDHALDVGTLARETGAQVIGSRTTCLIAQAEGLPRDRCRAVRGGESLRFGRLEVRVARVVHSAPSSIGLFQELDGPPSNVIAAPNGGALGFRFRLTTASGRTRVSWFYSNSIAPLDSDDGSGVDFEASLRRLFRDRERPAVWFAAPFGGAAVLAPHLDIIRPYAVVPHRWDGIAPTVTEGVTAPFEPGDLEQELRERNIALIAPRQYFEKFRSAGRGVAQADNRAVQRQLIAPSGDVQPNDRSGDPASSLLAPDDCLGEPAIAPSHGRPRGPRASQGGNR